MTDTESIQTPCPSCGSRTLFIGKSGHLTCSWLECPEPVVETAIAKLKRDHNDVALRVIRNLSAIAWDFGATYFTDSPMNRFAQKLQALVNEAEAETMPETTTKA